MSAGSLCNQMCKKRERQEMWLSYRQQPEKNKVQNLWNKMDCMWGKGGEH